MLRRDIVVIGGSAGALASLRTILRGLPADFLGSLLVVLHLTPDYPSVLDEVLSNWGSLPAKFAIDGEPVLPSHIYVARPDHHLIVDPEARLRSIRGPRENRHRPAIDPLFRSATKTFGPRLIGVVLSGSRDDGSAGLFAVRQRGGIAIVQDPEDAAFPEMPRHALKYASPQYVLSARDIAPKLVSLVMTNLDTTAMTTENPPSSAVHIGSPTRNLKTAYFDESEGIPSVFACPECHGVLWELKDKDLVRFRCRVGHSFGADSLAVEMSLASETALWAAVRALEEKAALHRRAADTAADEKTARRLRDQSATDGDHARLIREMIFQADTVSESTAPPRKKTA